MMTRTFEPKEMRGTQSVALLTVSGQYRAVRLPYKGSAGMAAIFVLPDPEAYESIMDAARDITGAAVLDPKPWQDLDEAFSVSVPRFKVEVKQLGLKEVSRCKCKRGWGAWQLRHVVMCGFQFTRGCQ